MGKLHSPLDKSYFNLGLNMNDFYVILLFAVFGVTSFALIFTGNIRAKDNLIDYIKNQKAHHKQMNFRKEFKTLLKDQEIQFEEKYLL